MIIKYNTEKLKEKRANNLQRTIYTHGEWTNVTGQTSKKLDILVKKPKTIRLADFFADPALHDIKYDGTITRIYR